MGALALLWCLPEGGSAKMIAPFCSQRSGHSASAIILVNICSVYSIGVVIVPSVFKESVLNERTLKLSKVGASKLKSVVPRMGKRTLLP